MYSYEYERAGITVDATVFFIGRDGTEILLIKRKNDPYKDCWALPGGFMNMGETAVEALSRELMEETNVGVNPEDWQDVGLFDAVDRDPRGRTISIAFGHIIDEECEIKAGDDAAECSWFPINDIRSGKIDLAFDHDEILKQGIWCIL